jgi:DNA replication ATP-dependent helicase Dna2
MPEPQQPRPGLQLLREAGDEWEAEKLSEVLRLFGANAVFGNITTVPSTGATVFRDAPLARLVRSARPDTFLIRSQYEIAPGSHFESALGIADLRAIYGLRYSDLVPDIIHVVPQGRIATTTRDVGVDATGNTFALLSTDSRLRLRIIDVKLTAEPNPGYFAEIAYYSMALAGWLDDQKLSDRFVVVADAAVWPGSHEASNITRYSQECGRTGISTTPQGLFEALEADLEKIPFEVFAFRVRRLLSEDLRRVLSQNWTALEWHVDNRCSGCDYLGYPWISGGQPTNRPNHCMPEAERLGQLSRVAFISRGSRAVLNQEGVTTVTNLANLSSDAAHFDQHQALRSSRTVLPYRASSLLTSASGIAPDSGSSGVMPRYADLRIYMTCDFDVGSAISFSFGVKGFWVEKRPFNSTDTTPRSHHAWLTRVFVVPDRSVDEERRQFLAFLDHVRTIVADARIVANRPDFQVYIWDKVTYKHLCRVVGRHLDAILAQKDLAHLAWLFPADELLPNADHQTSASPITIVQDVVRAVLAAPIPHYYNLFAVARSYHEVGLAANIAAFSLHPLFEDEFSDHIPSERAHEIWTKSTKPNSYWTRQIVILQETVEKRLRALETVVKRLETDLRPLLGKNAASFPMDPPRREGSISIDGELWLAYQRLNAALEQLSVAQTWAMPVHEREAKHHSARLTRRLTEDEEEGALHSLGLEAATGLRVYEMRPASSEVRARVDDFGFALAPEATAGFLEASFYALAQRHGIATLPRQARWRMYDATSVSIAAIDRGRRLIAVQCSAFLRPTMLDELEQAGVADLSTNVVMDPFHTDFFTGRLVDALRGLGNPPSAAAGPLVRRALGTFLWPRPPKQTEHRPAADFIWDAGATQQIRVARDVPRAREILEGNGFRLNASQWLALEEALSRRLHLIWGPPGTGKSRTLRTTLLGAILESIDRRKPLRVLLTASTWNAIDNVLYELLGELRHVLVAGADVQRFRLRGSSRGSNVPTEYDEIDTALSARNPSEEVMALRTRLEQSVGVTIVATTPQQVLNLMRVAGVNHEPLFDLLAIDEASQMDVANSILAFSSLAPGASAILAGDPKQLSPIHAAEPPVGLEPLVGSVYDFFHEHHRVAHTMLDTNYRSNADIVEFSRLAGYEPTLTPQSPDLRLNLLGGVLPQAQAPGSWPDDLAWSDGWAQLIDPARPVCCFVYPEGRSSQWNPFEAEAIVSISRLLFGRLADGLVGVRDMDGNTQSASTTSYGPKEFWGSGIGIVTPHRAQQGLAIARLAQAFAPLGHAEAFIRGAVDTVERFQGQQRDVILATFALGDPDSIRDEDEFLYSLNRFNVMASRARAKLIVFVSQEIVDHLATDIDVMHNSKLLKVFAESFCAKSQDLTLAYTAAGAQRPVPGLLKWR